MKSTKEQNHPPPQPKSLTSPPPPSLSISKPFMTSRLPTKIFDIAIDCNISIVIIIVFRKFIAILLQIFEYLQFL